MRLDRSGMTADSGQDMITRFNSAGADKAGPKPSFGPTPNADKLEGNPDLGIDPREAVKRAGDGK